jgi:hypothetical protein
MQEVNNLYAPCTRCGNLNLAEEDYKIETAEGKEMFVCRDCVQDSDKSLDPFPWEKGW